MEYGAFQAIVDDCKQRKPMLFRLESDRIPSADEVYAIEREIQIRLPEKYKAFIRQYGGGYFGFANIYSLDKESSFFLLNHNNIPIDEYLRLADNGCGDYYAVRVDAGACGDQLYFIDHEEKICPTEYADILEYLVRVGLKWNINV